MTTVPFKVFGEKGDRKHATRIKGVYSIKGRRYLFCKLAGKRRNLKTDDPVEANRRWLALKDGAEKDAAAKMFSAGSPLVCVLADDYLEWVHLNRPPKAYAFYRLRLNSFIGFVGKRLTVAELLTLPNCGCKRKG